MLKMNKGEWSESYCILKTIADACLHLCDADLSLLGTTLPLVGGRLSADIHFDIDEDEVHFHVKDSVVSISRVEIEALSTTILQVIKSPPEKTTFSIQPMNTFIQRLNHVSIKSKSTSKADCYLTVHDEHTHTSEHLSYTIKSFLGGSPTLINASRATNFTFTLSQNRELPKTLKAKKLLLYLNSENITLIFKSMDSDIYRNNIMRIDTQMPIILAELLSIYYGSKKKSMLHLTEILTKQNPLALEDTSIYQAKVEDFLFASALGLIPNTVWSGLPSVDGGCLIVRANGDVLTFYIFRLLFLPMFKTFLLNTCYLDTPSTTRHGFGNVYNEDGKSQLKLNLQVRIACI